MITEECYQTKIFPAKWTEIKVSIHVQIQGQYGGCHPLHPAPAAVSSDCCLVDLVGFCVLWRPRPQSQQTAPMRRPQLHKSLSIQCLLAQEGTNLWGVATPYECSMFINIDEPVESASYRLSASRGPGTSPSCSRVVRF